MWPELPLMEGSGLPAGKSSPCEFSERLQQYLTVNEDNFQEEPNRRLSKPIRSGLRKDFGTLLRFRASRILNHFERYGSNDLIRSEVLGQSLIDYDF